MRLENIGAGDIVDGNPRMILALIWTVILRFQIQEIEIDVDEDVTVKVLRRNLLKMLCCFGVRGRPMAISKNWFGVIHDPDLTSFRNVAISDFSSSWQSGLGFNALIHRFYLLHYV